MQCMPNLLYAYTHNNTTYIKLHLRIMKYDLQYTLFKITVAYFNGRHTLRKQNSILIIVYYICHMLMFYKKECYFSNTP